MKTVDLIPFILFELSSGDKYGIELTKNIETKSCGKIIVKQPTLYTVLKKLEKSKFISSYWLDSDIGGKRHYYKLTENGRLQLSTLPSYDELINSTDMNEQEDSSEMERIAENEESISLQSNTSFNNSEPSTSVKKDISFLDLLNPVENEPVESVASTKELFENSNIDNATEMDVNLSNVSMLKEQLTNHQEKFVESSEVATFSNNNLAKLSPEYKDNLTQKANNKTESSFERDSKHEIDSERIEIKDEEIKYVDYKDFKKNPNYINAKKCSKKLCLASVLTSAYLALILVLCSVVSSKTGFSPLFGVLLIFGGLFVLLFPSYLISNYEINRLKFQKTPYHPSYKTHLIIAFAVLVVLFATSLIVSAKSGMNSLTQIFGGNNFSNMYAPLLVATTPFVDLLVVYLLNKESSQQIDKTNNK